MTAVFVRGLQRAHQTAKRIVTKDPFYYPDQFNQDGSNTGFAWAGYGKGVFCILNSIVATLPSEPGLRKMTPIQVWEIKAGDLTIGSDGRYNLQGKDVSAPLGGPDLIYVQKASSAGPGAILVWRL